MVIGASCGHLMKIEHGHCGSSQSMRLIFCWLRSYGVAAAWRHMRNCSGTLTECCTKSENKLEGLWPLSDAHPRTMWTQDFVLKGLNAEGVFVVFGESVFVLLRSR